MRPRIYTDTSVIGGCLDEEFKEASLQLINMFKLGAAVLVPTLSSLTGSHWIHLTDLFPTHATAFKRHLVAPCTEVMGLVVPSHADPLTPVEALADPTHGWPRRRWGELRGSGRVVTPPLPAPSALGHRLHQAGSRQHPPQPVHPTGLRDHA
jgi:hypothetical protein